MIIGVTQRIDEVLGNREYRDAVDQQLIKWIIEAGFIPVPIPNILANLNSTINNQDKLYDWLSAMNIGALLFSGGNDIGTFPQRDLTEKSLLRWAEKNIKPVLGICRGMQMIGIFAGSSLIEVEMHVKTKHYLQLNGIKSILFPEPVNSYHNYALKSCPEDFELLATSEEGSIEAIRHKKLPWEGWMWHPEREDNFSLNDQHRFIKLINHGKN
jgi:N5-(cytidine 5'-diphosphoramidyl)-L-glutamine hydrolase